MEIDTKIILGNCYEKLKNPDNYLDLVFVPQQSLKGDFNVRAILDFMR